MVTQEAHRRDFSHRPLQACISLNIYAYIHTYTHTYIHAWSHRKPIGVISLTDLFKRVVAWNVVALYICIAGKHVHMYVYTYVCKSFAICYCPKTSSVFCCVCVCVRMHAHIVSRFFQANKCLKCHNGMHVCLRADSYVFGCVFITHLYVCMCV
jgi:hypothetical protein